MVGVYIGGVRLDEEMALVILSALFDGFLLLVKRAGTARTRDKSWLLGVPWEDKMACLREDVSVILPAEVFFPKGCARASKSSVPSEMEYRGYANAQRRPPKEAYEYNTHDLEIRERESQGRSNGGEEIPGAQRLLACRLRTAPRGSQRLREGSGG